MRRCQRNGDLRSKYLQIWPDEHHGRLPLPSHHVSATCAHNYFHIHTWPRIKILARTKHPCSAFFLRMKEDYVRHHALFASFLGFRHHFVPRPRFVYSPLFVLRPDFAPKVPFPLQTPRKFVSHHCPKDYLQRMHKNLWLRRDSFCLRIGATTRGM